MVGTQGVDEALGEAEQEGEEHVGHGGGPYPRFEPRASGVATLSRVRSPLLPTPLLLLALLLCTACQKQDEGPERLRQADARYEALVAGGVQSAPADPRVQALIQEYEAIPEDSKARPQAEKRLAALRGLTRRPPPRPLAVPGSEGPGASAADLQRAACAKLAEQLGTSSAEARPALQRSLAECREKQARLEADEHPPGEDDAHP